MIEEIEKLQAELAHKKKEKLAKKPCYEVLSTFSGFRNNTESSGRS